MPSSSEFDASRLAPCRPVLPVSPAAHRPRLLVAPRTSVWTPPGQTELSPEAKAKVEPFLSAELGAHAKAVLEVFERFEAAAPSNQDFYYLSFLGTHPEHRGHGFGMSLLEANLTQVDAESMPAYLESSNPANNARYERLGFKPHAEFATPDGKHSVTTMWREAR